MSTAESPPLPSFRRSSDSHLIKEVVFDWVSDASGDASIAITEKISGFVVGCIFDPGTPAPTANYTVVINNSNGVDILSGRGALGDLSATVSTQIAPAVTHHDGTTTGLAPPTVFDTLTCVVASAGNTKQGKVILHIY